jgi:hypothetical protein
MGMESSALIHPISPVQMEAMPSPLSSRPEHSVVEGSAVRPSDSPISEVLTQTLKPDSFCRFYGTTEVVP